MKLFDFLKKEEKKIPESDLKWNKMWDLWASEEAKSPYAEIMTYHSEVNNGGHYSFFDNSDVIEETVEILKEALPDVLSECVLKGYDAYMALEEGTDNEEEQESVLAECDDIFYENESLIEDMLKEYAETIEL